MLRAIVIDNEKSLNQLKKLAGTNDNVNLIASFTDPLEGLANLADLEPDVVFLSTDMPEINSIAEQIIKSCPDTCIVFVASHDDYALKAFELNALDYLLKPVTRERFCQCVDKLLKYGGGNIDARSFHDLNYHFNENSKVIYRIRRRNNFNKAGGHIPNLITTTFIAATAPIWLIWIRCPDLSIIQNSLRRGV